MIKNTIGDLLNIKQPIIIGHQVNCLGIMGAGIAKSIKSKWFNVFTEPLTLLITSSLLFPLE